MSLAQAPASGAEDPLAFLSAAVERRQPAQADRRRTVWAGPLPFADRRRPGQPDRRNAASATRQRGLDGWVQQLLATPDLDTLLLQQPSLRPQLTARAATLIEAAWQQGDADALLALHRTLYLLYSQTFALPLAGTTTNQYHPLLVELCRQIETAWEQSLTLQAETSVTLALAAGRSFSDTLTTLCQQHRLSHHPLFDYLEHHATREQMVTFFLHDSAVVLRFFDLLVLSMVGSDEATRAELAENLRDEMGLDDPEQRHTSLFRRLLTYVGVSDDALQAQLADFHRRAPWPCLAGHNLYLLFGLHRRHYYRSLGCLGSAELMDPAQYAKIVRGCQRLGWTDPDGLAYYMQHAEVDVDHGQGWLDHVLLPLTARVPGAEREFLWGTVFRLETAAQYYDHLLASMRSA